MWCRYKRVCWLWAGVLALALAGCSPEQKSLALMKDPQGLQKIVQRCQRLSVARQKQDPVCAQAFYAAQQLHQLSAALMADPQGFGQQIIHEQIKLVQLNETRKQTRSADKRDALQAQIDSLHEHIAMMQAVTVLAGE